MTDKSKTHYRKAFTSPYLSSADIVDPTVLTISKVLLEPDKSKKTKDMFNTAYFTEKELRQGEPLKPMILNAGNSKILAKRTGTKWIDDWNNIPVTVYVDSNVRFGRDVVEGLRIMVEAPKTVKANLEPGTEMWTRAITAYCRDKNLKTVEKHVNISPENKKLLIAEATQGENK